MSKILEWPSIGCGKEYKTLSDYSGYRIEDAEGNIIIPAGRYALIYGCFCRGYVRVRNNAGHWGIVNEVGKEVVPVKMYNIWNFYKQKYTLPYTTVEPRKGDDDYHFVFDIAQLIQVARQ